MAKPIRLPPITLDARQPLNPEFHIHPSSSKLDFWGPLYEDQNGNIISPGFTSYAHNRNIWDYVTFMINGRPVKTPGIANVHFVRSKSKDKKKSVGEDATTTTTYGIKAAEIVIELDLWMPEDKMWIDQYVPILFPKPGKDGGKQPVFSVQHPLFKTFNIKAVLVHGCEGPMKHSVARGKVFKIHCTEWMPTSTKKAGGSAPPPSLAAETSLEKIGLQSLPGEHMAGKTK